MYLYTLYKCLHKNAATLSDLFQQKSAAQVKEFIRIRASYNNCGASESEILVKQRLLVSDSSWVEHNLVTAACFRFRNLSTSRQRKTKLFFKTIV